MNMRLAELGNDWQDLADHIADWSADLLRRAAAEMAHGLDRDAQHDIEGAGEWRDLSKRRGFST